MDKKVVYVFGAFYDFNFGDHLFPFMVEHALERCRPNAFDFKRFSLVASDFRRYGSFETGSYKDLRRSIQSTDDVIVVAGGQSISAPWHLLYAFINPKFAIVYKLFGARIGKYIDFAKHLGGVSEFPFAVDKNAFKCRPRVLYNSVGGECVSEVITERLKEAEYVAIRDTTSAQSLEGEGVRGFHLVPDSAIVLSEVSGFKDSFSDSVKPEIRQFENTDFIFFQIGAPLAPKDLGPLASELKNLSIKTGYKVILCPIGTAPFHEDQKPLKTLHKLLGARSEYVNNPNLFEIAFLLSKAALYIGTSLHGAIGAMSYGRPYIGLTDISPKLANYLSTWGHPKLKHGANLGEIQQRCLDALGVPRQEIEEEHDIQKKLYYRSAERMASILLQA